MNNKNNKLLTFTCNNKHDMVLTLNHLLYGRKLNLQDIEENFSKLKYFFIIIIVFFLVL